jgi:hypothetical protein
MNPCQACWDALAEARAENKTIRADEREKAIAEVVAELRRGVELFPDRYLFAFGAAADHIEKQFTTSKGET